MMIQDQDIVVSSRVRLARNISGIPFSPRISEEQAKELCARIEARLNPSKEFRVYHMKELSQTEKQVFIEHHLMSRDMLQKPNSMILLSKDDKIAVLVGEEDHLRIQCILPGWNIVEADTLSRAVDMMLAPEGYAFDDKLGYLTTCPTNVGTGMRASVMLHLCGLAATEQISGLADTVSRFGFVLRGYFGEGTSGAGDMFQLSNQETLGVSEEEIYSSLTQLVRSIIDKETALRNALLKNDNGQFTDQIYRSLGILKSAHLLTTDEMMRRMSQVKLGVSLRLIEGIDNQRIERIIQDMQPASIELSLGRKTDSQARDQARAKAVRLALQESEIY